MPISNAWRRPRWCRRGKPLLLGHRPVLRAYASGAGNHDDPTGRRRPVCGADPAGARPDHDATRRRLQVRTHDAASARRDVRRRAVFAGTRSLRQRPRAGADIWHRIPRVIYARGVVAIGPAVGDAALAPLPIGLRRHRVLRRGRLAIALRVLLEPVHAILQGLLPSRGVGLRSDRTPRSCSPAPGPRRASGSCGCRAGCSSS